MNSHRLEKQCFPPPLPGGAPWLVYLRGKMQIFNSISPNNQSYSYSKSIPEFHGKFIRASCYGWLLFQKFMFLSLWNPMTMETISLPPLICLLDLDADVRINTCAITSSPDDDDDFAVLIFCDRFVFSCRPRKNPLRRWGVDELQIEGNRASVTKAVACKGVIFAWVRITTPDDEFCGMSFVTLKVNVADDGDNRFITLTSLQLESTNFIRSISMYYINCNLIESCGRIYEVYVTCRHCLDPRVSTVEVWELDLEMNKWVEAKSLDDRAFFLDRFGCAWCWANVDGVGVEIEGNSVYFLAPSVNDDVHTVVCQYRLKDRSIKILRGPYLQFPRQESLWFIPQHPRCTTSLARTLPKASVVDEVVNIVHSDKQLLPKQTETTEDMVDYLPLHIIHSISEYLHWFDYLTFRSSCKSIQSILSPSRCRWKRTYDNTLPLFVSLKDYDGVFDIVDLFRNDSRSIMISNPVKGAFAIDFCKDGWVVVCNGGSSFHFFNLFTRMKKDFPPLQFKTDFNSVGFSTCPNSSDCVIVGMGEVELLTIWYIRSGDKNWQSAKFDSVDEEFSPSTCSPIYHNGGFYFLDTKGRVGVFELVGEKATWLLYGSPQVRDTLFMSCHLVDCDGQLFSVFIGKLGKWIQVFRFDDLKKNWVRVKSIGKHVFFVSRSLSLSTVAREAGMGNRVYLPRLYENHFMFYSLETCKCHVVGTQLSMENFVPSAEPLQCSWVQFS